MTDGSPADDASSSARFRAALEAGDREGLRAVPRADLHRHAAFGGGLAAYRAWRGEDLPAPPERFPTFDDFRRYIRQVLLPPEVVGTPEAERRTFEFMLGNSLAEAAADGVTYLELGIDLMMADLYAGGDGASGDGGVEAFVARVRAIHAERAPGLGFRPDLGVIRHNDTTALEARAAPLIESGLFGAIDLCGDEHRGAPEDFAPLFRRARAAGLVLKAHAGEYRDADFVLRSVEVLDLDEVQHGIAAASSGEVLRALRARGVTLNVCPSSNVRLCRAPSYAAHPIRRLHDAGVRVTINTDDVMIFGQSLSDEYLHLFRAGCLSAAELDAIRARGLERGRAGAPLQRL